MNTAIQTLINGMTIHNVDLRTNRDQHSVWVNDIPNDRRGRHNPTCLLTTTNYGDAQHVHEYAAKACGRLRFSNLDPGDRFMFPPGKEVYQVVRVMDKDGVWVHRALHDDHDVGAVLVVDPDVIRITKD